jgi:hypothetical protein
LLCLGTGSISLVGCRCHCNALTFQQKPTPKPLGREDKGAVTYGNDDLPNLRAAATADLLALITDTAPRPARLRRPPTNSELLNGRVRGRP